MSLLFVSRIYAKSTIKRLQTFSAILPLIQPLSRAMSTQSQGFSKGQIHWVLDWDGTITQKDTLDTLVNIAASAKPDFPTFDRWKAVVDAYISDYTTSLEKLAPNGSLPTTIPQEKELLKALKPVEQRSLDRVAESRIFEGLTSKILKDGAEEAICSGDVVLRPGCTEFINCILNSDDSKLSILSVNWSRQFILFSLEAAGIHIPPASIFANELDGIDEGKASKGVVSPDGYMKIISSGDKLRCLDELREKGSTTIVYIGDSWPDIECLLTADLGICIRDEPVGSSQKKLADALQRLGVKCAKVQDSSGIDGLQVVWAQNFFEIKDQISKV